MKIVTYNMNRGGVGRTQWNEVLIRVQPEILLAQETFAPQEHLPTLLNGNRYERAVWQPVPSNGRSQYWGSAIFAESMPTAPVPLPAYQGWVVGAEATDFRCPDGTHRRLRIFSLHAPTGQGGYQKAVNSILDMVRDHRDGCEVVMGGDFNLTVSQRHASEARTTVKADLQIQARLRNEFGFVNCWQTANPDTPLAQTLAWNRDKSVPYHCDGLFVPETWAPRLKSCIVLSGEVWNQLSDHRPVVAEFEPTVS